MVEFMTAENLGSVKNRLGFLSADKTRVVPKRIVEATGLKPAQLAKLLDVPRPSLYRETLPISADLQERILHLCVATDLVFELTNDFNETQKWLVSPSTFFFGASPLQIILSGRGKEIIEWLLPRTGHRAGAAF